MKESGKEQYTDSAAALAHSRTFGKEFGERFMRMVDRTRFMVFGNPSDELRGLLDGFGAKYLKPFGDFAYWVPKRVPRSWAGRGGLPPCRMYEGL